MFTCCHPALSLEARVALTLRTLAGLTTAEIARAFLASEPTMAKRLVRAKQKIQHAGIPYRVPPAHLLPERTPGVLGVLYLLFNEGYSATAGADLVRQNLSAEAIRLARVLARLMPDEPEAAGPAGADAAARRAPGGPAGRPRRPGDPGGPGPALWDAAEIGEGVAAAGRRACGAGSRVPTRSRRPSPPATPPRPPRRTPTGRRSPRLYEQLAPFLPTPVVAAEPRGRGGDGRGPGGRARAGRGAGGVRASWPVTTCCPRPGPTSCAASAGRGGGRRLPRSAGGWPAPTRSAVSCAAGWPKPATGLNDLDGSPRPVGALRSQAQEPRLSSHG